MLRRLSSLLLLTALWPTGPLAAQGPLTPGRPATGAITPGDARMGDGSWYDEWTLTARARKRYRIALTSSDFDAYLAVGRGQGDGFDQLVTDDDGGGGTNASLLFTAPSDGPFVVRANTLREGETGNYTLTVTDEGELPPLRPVALAMGQAVGGRLDGRDQMSADNHPIDYFKFTARANRLYALWMLSRDFDAVVEVGTGADGAFTKERSDDDGAGGTNARMEWVARRNGEVWIAAHALNADTGRYLIILEDLGDAPPPSEVVMLKPDRPINGTLASGDETGENGWFDVYSIEGQEGEVVVIDMASEAFDPYLSIGRGEGAEWTELDKDDDGGLGTDAHLAFRLPETGKFLIRARGVGTRPGGAYTIRME